MHMLLIPDSKDHGANMGPIWGRQDPGGPHVGPMNLAISDDNLYFDTLNVSKSTECAPGGALGQVSYGGGCAAPGSEPLPYFRESQTPKTYPIVGKSHNPGHPKRSGLQKHTLF